MIDVRGSARARAALAPVPFGSERGCRKNDVIDGGHLLLAQAKSQQFNPVTCDNGSQTPVYM